MLSLERHADEARTAARTCLDRATGPRSKRSSARWPRARRVKPARVARTRWRVARRCRSTPRERHLLVDSERRDRRGRRAPIRALATGIASEWTPSIRHGDRSDSACWARCAGQPVDRRRARADRSQPRRLDRRAIEPRGWAVAYADSSGCSATAKLGRLVSDGYDFALSQLEPATRRSGACSSIPARRRSTIRRARRHAHARRFHARSAGSISSSPSGRAKAGIR